MEMSFGNINAEFLIALVESRPALWDKSLEAKASQRTAAWKDICRILNPDFNTFTRTQQHAHVRFIYKKWVNIRDAWKKRKNYKHSARLKFLEKNLTIKKKLSWNITGSEQSVSLISDTDSDSSKNSDFIKEAEEKRGNEESIQGEQEVNTIQFMDIKPVDENCPHISFIKGLLPILNKLGVDEVLEFQMGVIQLLQGIRRRSMIVTQISSPRYDMPSSSFDLSHLKVDRELD